MGVWGLSFNILSIHGSFMSFIDLVNIYSTYSSKLIISMLSEKTLGSPVENPWTFFS